MSPRLSWSRLLLWLLASVALTWVVGVWPAWHFHGTAGLLAGAAATALVLVVFLLMAMAVKYLANHYGAVAAVKLLGLGGLGRMILTVVLAAVVRPMLDLPVTVFWPWVAGLYLLCAMVEAVWASLGLGLKKPKSPPA